MKSKHVPQRTCVICRQTKYKNHLIRLVRSENGIVEVDVSARKPGRGAYLCPQKSCWEVALKKDRLEHTLRTKLSEDNRQALINYGNNLPEGS